MPLRPSKAVTIDSPDYFTKLVVRPVRRDDTGEYTVTAVNSSGKDTVTINVLVTDKPNKPEGPIQVGNSFSNLWYTKIQLFPDQSVSVFRIIFGKKFTGTEYF